MSDITLACGNLAEISVINKKLSDLAQIGYEPINLTKFEMGPLGYDVCVLLGKK